MINKYYCLSLLLVLLSGCADEEPIEHGVWQDCYNHYRAESYKVAAISCEKSFNQGVVHAAWLLGHINYYDLAQQKTTIEQGFAWYLKAAESGWPEAQTYIGESYMYGDGVTQDFTKAYDWLIKAAQYRDPNAEFALGMLFYDGKGRPKDISTAIIWFKKAASKRHAMSINNLTWIYATSPHKAFRSSEQALLWADRLDEKLMSQQTEQSIFLDTKAAAHALAENFELAVTLQNQAISLLPENVEESRLLDFQKHLEAYQQNQAWQEEESLNEK
jgi:TPR repeat protein